MEEDLDQQQNTNMVTEPLDLLRLSLDEQTYVKMRNGSFEVNHMLIINI